MLGIFPDRAHAKKPPDRVWSGGASEVGHEVFLQEGGEAVIENIEDLMWNKLLKKLFGPQFFSFSSLSRDIAIFCCCVH